MPAPRKHPDKAIDGLFIGLMSGTSVDGIDAVLTRFTGDDLALVATHFQPYPDRLRAQTFAVSRGETDDLHAVAALDRDIAGEFAAAALALCVKAGVSPGEVAAIGSHGQTVRHAPDHVTGGPSGNTQPYTVQIGDGNSIAEATGICTVADFRRRDIAAGGQGAPLVPAAHAAFFGETGERRAIVNIGGIANITLLEGREVAAGYDCGPGNTLLDGWINRHRGEPFDRDGAWAAEHAVHDGLLEGLLADDYFHRTGPRSTGPERFNLAWLDATLGSFALLQQDPGAVQATLAELTVRGIVDALAGDALAVDGVYVCGGGARNTDLMRRLHAHLAPRQIKLATTEALGMAPEWVEGCAFAWLARQTLAGLPGNAPAVTGAAGPRVLGAIYSAG